MSINYNELGDGASADTSGRNLTVCLFTSRRALSTSKRYLKYNPPPQQLALGRRVNMDAIHHSKRALLSETDAVS